MSQEASGGWVMCVSKSKTILYKYASSYILIGSPHSINFRYMLLDGQVFYTFLNCPQELLNSGTSETKL